LPKPKFSALHFPPFGFEYTRTVQRS